MRADSHLRLRQERDVKHKKEREREREKGARKGFSPSLTVLTWLTALIALTTLLTTFFAVVVASTRSLVSSRPSKTEFLILSSQSWTRMKPLSLDMNLFFITRLSQFSWLLFPFPLIQSLVGSFLQSFVRLNKRACMTSMVASQPWFACKMSSPECLTGSLEGRPLSYACIVCFSSRIIRFH